MMFARNFDAQNEVCEKIIYVWVCVQIKPIFFYLHREKTERDVDYLLELN